MVAVGLMVGFGFMFGIVFSYAGMIETGGGGPGGDIDFEGELPAENYVEGSFGLGQQEQFALTSRNDVVFVNAYYENEEQLEEMRWLESVPEDFNNRVYVQVTEADSGSPPNLPLSDYPSIAVLGSSQASPAVEVESVSREEVEAAVCDTMRDISDVAAMCV